jgi:hypothetical protein
MGAGTLLAAGRPLVAGPTGDDAAEVGVIEFSSTTDRRIRGASADSPMISCERSHPNTRDGNGKTVTGRRVSGPPFISDDDDRNEVGFFLRRPRAAPRIHQGMQPESAEVAEMAHNIGSLLHALCDLPKKLRFGKFSFQLPGSCGFRARFTWLCLRIRGARVVTTTATALLRLRPE